MCCLCSETQSLCMLQLCSLTLQVSWATNTPAKCQCLPQKTDLVNCVFLSIKVGNSGGPLVNLVWLLVFNNICYQFYTYFQSSSKLLAEWIRCVIENKTHWIKKGKIFSIVLWGCWKKVEAKSWIELINLTQDTGKHLLVNINVSFQLGRLCVMETNYWKPTGFKTVKSRLAVPKVFTKTKIFSCLWAKVCHQELLVSTIAQPCVTSFFFKIIQ